MHIMNQYRGERKADNAQFDARRCFKEMTIARGTQRREEDVP